jgi:putative SOS response-associated peptidase YedK
MCGRFTLTATKKEIEKIFGKFEADWKPNYNVAPTQKLPIITEMGVEIMNWGMKLGPYKPINLRLETLKNYPKCLVITDGFYEWKNKRPYYFSTGKLFTFAGVYNDGFAIVTKEAEGVVKKYHSRMPVIAGKEWFSGEFIIPKLEARKVSSRVGSVKNNDAQLISKI